MLEVGTHAAGAADAGDDHRVRLVEAHLLEDDGQLHHDRADPAAGAPDGGEELHLEVLLVADLGHRQLGHALVLSRCPTEGGPAARWERWGSAAPPDRPPALVPGRRGWPRC